MLLKFSCTKTASLAITLVVPKLCLYCTSFSLINNIPEKQVLVKKLNIFCFRRKQTEIDRMSADVIFQIYTNRKILINLKPNITIRIEAEVDHLKTLCRSIITFQKKSVNLPN